MVLVGPLPVCSWRLPFCEITLLLLGFLPVVADSILGPVELIYPYYYFKGCAVEGNFDFVYWKHCEMADKLRGALLCRMKRDNRFRKFWFPNNERFKISGIWLREILNKLFQICAVARDPVRPHRRKQNGARPPELQ
jgi:hypothetical protein